MLNQVLYVQQFVHLSVRTVENVLHLTNVTVHRISQEIIVKTVGG